jgi:osmoprotectant transport system permease protein
MRPLFGASARKSSRTVNELLGNVREHLALCAAALAIALLAGIALGAFCARNPRTGPWALTFVNVLRTIPSLAIVGLAIPLLGVGFVPAVAALTVLAVPPIALATDAGLRNVPASVRDAARGLGMSEGQVRRRVDWPLALPVVFSGVHTATVEVIAGATLAAFIGGGGLGEPIVNGLANNDLQSLLAGAVAVAALTLTAEALLGAAERRIRA